MKSWITDHLYQVVIAGILGMVALGMWVTSWFVGPIDFGPIAGIVKDLLGVATVFLLVLGNLLLVMVDIAFIMAPGVVAVAIYPKIGHKPGNFWKVFWVFVFSLLGGAFNVMLALLFVHLKPWLVVGLGNSLQEVVDGKLVIPWFVAGMTVSLASSILVNPKSK